MLEFRILGPVGIWSEGVELPLRGSKQRTILAALLLAREWVVSDAKLGEVLWGKTPPTTYQAQIYTYASRVRHQLGTGATIIRQGHGYRLDAGAARFDLTDFEELSEAGYAAGHEGKIESAAKSFHAALDLWDGPTLMDVTEGLAENELPRIELARMEVLESRIDADLMLGRHQDVIGELVQIVSRYPLRESFRAKLMIALYRCDRQAEAFATFREGSRLLQDELGVDPGPGLRTAHQAILTNDLRLTLPRWTASPVAQT